MIVWILKRLLLAVPTFLGITLLTFGILSLAADPVTALAEGRGTLPRSPLSPQEAQRLAESLGFDRPALLATDLLDAPGRVRELADRVAAGGDGAAQARETLRNLGPLAWSHLRPLLDTAGGALRVRLLDAAAAAAGRPLPDAAALADADREFGPRLRPGAAEAAVGDWVARVHAGEPLAALEVLAPYRGLAVAPLVEAFADRGLPEPAFRSGLDFLDAHGSAPGLARARDLGGREAALAALDRWWGRHHLEFRELGLVERWGRFAWTETRYAGWLGRILGLDFGTSTHYRRPVSEMIWRRLPVTLLIQALAVFLMYAVGLPLGVWSAVTRRRLLDRLVTFLLFVLFATPAFFAATLAILFLASPTHLDLFPVHGIRSADVDVAIRSGELGPWSWTALSDLAWHLVLPVAALAYGGFAVVSRYTRTGVMEALARPFVTAARARGLPERTVVLRHALRHGLVPAVTLLGALVPVLVGGSVVIESVFGIDGMGALALQAALAGDVPLAMGVVTLVAIATMVGYLLTDVLYAWLDPRVRGGRRLA